MEELIGRIKEIAKQNPNGFTIKIPDCTFVTSGWVIAMKETQNSFGDKGLEKVIEVAQQTTFIMGGWKNGRLFYYDAVHVTNDEAEATKLGIENNQIAIFNLDETREKFL